MAGRSLLDARLSLNEPDNDVDEVLVDTYLSEMGTEQQLATFFQRYANHQGLSDKCALDGRYFWRTLSSYPGLVDSDLFLRINQGPAVVACGGKVHRSFEALDIAFDINDLARTKDSSVRYRLIKLIIDIGNDPSENTGGVHTNLIYIDTKTKHVVRFEPMYDEYYSEKINDILKKYFAKLLPDYHYRMLHEHPQLPTTESCPSKGMCAAYVLKKAMMLVTGNDRPLNRDPKDEELKIMQFADAIETEYGILPADNEPEHGLTLAISPRAYASPYGPTVMYGPGTIPYAYPPEYYGFSLGPRFARRPGWGFGRHRHHHWGRFISQETGIWADVKNRLDTNYQKAKQQVKRGYGNINKKAKNLRQRRDKKQAQLSPIGYANLPRAGGGLYGRTGEYGDTHSHVHYHTPKCDCQGCQQAPPRGQSGYYSGLPSTQAQPSPYGSPGMYPSSPRVLATAVAAPPSSYSPQWNPVPPSRISIGRSPTGAAMLQNEVTQQGQYIDANDGSLVNYTKRTTTPLPEQVVVGGEFGCGCNGPEKKTAGPYRNRAENGRVLNTILGGVVGTFVGGPIVGTAIGAGVGYAASRPETGYRSNLAGPLADAALDNEYGRTDSGHRQENGIVGGALAGAGIGLVTAGPLGALVGSGVGAAIGSQTRSQPVYL